MKIVFKISQIYIWIALDNGKTNLISFERSYQIYLHSTT